MALPNQSTAAAFAELLRTSDNELLYLEYHHDMESWSEAEIRAVSDAAERSTAVRSLEIDVRGLTVDKANVVARITSHMHHVREIIIADSDRHNRRLAGNHLADALLRGIMSSRSNIERLRVQIACSRGSFREFIERFPNLQRLDIDGQGDVNFNRQVNDDDPEFDAFVSEVSLAIPAGKLPSLREMGFDNSVGREAFFRLLNAARHAPALEAIRFSVVRGSSGLLTDAFLLCAEHRPSSLTKVVVETNDYEEDPVDITPFFPAGFSATLSPTIREVIFRRCEAVNDDRTWLDRAALALENVERLGLVMCDFPFFVDLIERLPQLRRFSCLFRHELESREMYDWFDLEDFIEDPYVMSTNEVLTRFCQVIERPSSLLEAVELDVVSDNAARRFPAIATLLGRSKGQLVVTFGGLAQSNNEYVVRGVASLGVHLRELRIRFCKCQFKDEDFASFLHELSKRTSLKILEFGFDGRASFGFHARASLGTPESSIDAIRHLVQSNDSLDELALRGLGPDAVVAVVERIMPAMATTNRSLRKLDFYGAGLADVWPRIRGPILAALRTNGVLGQVGGDVRVPADDHGIRLLLKQNMYGGQLYASSIPIGLRATTLAIIARDTHHDVMYLFLREMLDPLPHPTHPHANGHPHGGVDSSSNSVM